MHAIVGMFYARASVTLKRVPRSLRTQKVLATAHQIARATLGRATDRSPIKIHNLERYTGAEWHDQHSKTAAALYTHVLEHAQTHHGIPLHANGVGLKHAAPQNSWPSDQPLVHHNPSY